jgi:hypothetical protein
LSEQEARSIAGLLFWQPARRTQNCFLIEKIALGKHVPFWKRKTQSAIFPQTKMEMTMRKKILTVLFVPLIAALAAQTAAASERHHTRTKDRAAACEQLRNSNAYAASGGIAVQSNWSDYANGAMASGIAGH